MSRSEIPLQHDMFTGETIDARSASQKRKDKEREQPRQAEMFSAREIAQFGVNAHPQIPLSPNTRLELSIVDTRSEEEIGEDRMRAAEALTYPLFDNDGSRGEERETTIGPTIAVLVKILGDLQLLATFMTELQAMPMQEASGGTSAQRSSYMSIVMDSIRVIQPY